MKPNGKCIAKKCEDCRFFENWDVTDTKTGLRSLEKKCSFEVLFKEIPKIAGSVDGCQRASNEARNRVQCLGDALAQSGAIGYEDKKMIGEN